MRRVINEDADYQRICQKIGHLICHFRRMICGQDYGEEACLDHLRDLRDLRIRGYGLSEFYQALESASRDITHILYERLNKPNITKTLSDVLEDQVWHERGKLYPPTSGLQFVGGNIFYEMVGDKPILDFLFESELGTTFVFQGREYCRTQ